MTRKMDEELERDDFESKEIIVILLHRLHEVAFILIITSVIFFLIALASYSRTDPGWSLATTNPEIKNAAGIIGAYTADLLLSVFGYFGYFIPILFAGIAAVWFKGLEIKTLTVYFLIKVLGAILTLIAGCGLANIHFSAMYNVVPESSGGIVGNITQQFVATWIGPIGSTLLLIAIFMVGITFVTSLSWVKLTKVTIFSTIAAAKFIYFGSIFLSLKTYALLKVLYSQLIKIISVVLPFLFNEKDLVLMDRRDELYQPLMEVNKDSNNNDSEFAGAFSSESSTLISSSESNYNSETKFDYTQMEEFANEQTKEVNANNKQSNNGIIAKIKTIIFYPFKILGLFSFFRKPKNLNSENFVSETTNDLNLELNKSYSKQSQNDVEADITLAEKNLDAHRIHPINKGNSDISGMHHNLTKEAANKTSNVKLKAKTNTHTKSKMQKIALPTGDLLEKIEKAKTEKGFNTQILQSLSRDVEKKLADFGAEVKVVAVRPGPVITRFELKLKPGLKASKITGLARDLARSLSVRSVRVIEVIPGKPVIGLEIPNKNREIVRLREIVESTTYNNFKSPLTLALGKDIEGKPVVTDLAKMPHLLVAGTTGSGKSVGVNAMLLSILYKSQPADVRLILIDPKMLELSIYESIPHLLTPVVTDMKDAANALNWCVGEMERRYQLMANVGVRNLKGFNEKVEEAIKSNQPILDPLWHPVAGEEHPILEKLPYIVVIIDEFADMMMVVGKKVEELIARIAQKARAAGIHMILATQRPSVDVITGIIKANIPTRMAFQVSSKIDSRTILDQMGAEQLLGNGDMLFLAPGTGMPERVHGAFVSDQEVHNVVNFLKEKSKTQYVTEICETKFSSNSTGFGKTTFTTSNVQGGMFANGFDDDRDELYDEAVYIVTDTRKSSISYLQRRLKIGFNRAARLLEVMEEEGIISAMKANGVREVLANPPPKE